MKKTQSNQPATTPAAAAPSPTGANPPAAARPDTYTRVFDAAIQYLCLDEGEVPMLARKILRMRRDKAPYDEICRMTEPLFKSIIGSAITQDWVPDPKSGLSEFEIEQTPQLKALLRKLRTPSNSL